MSNDRWVRKRHRRHAENPHCHWCGVETVLTEGHVKRPPPNMATLDHLDDRFSQERGRYPGQRRIVLACVTCNNRRGIERQAELKGLQRAKSQLGHIVNHMKRVQWPPRIQDNGEHQSPA